MVCPFSKKQEGVDFFFGASCFLLLETLLFGLRFVAESEVFFKKSRLFGENHSESLFFPNTTTPKLMVGTQQAGHQCGQKLF